MLGQFDKTNQDAALSTAMAVEEILAGVDVEGRACVAVQGTEPDELLAACGGAGGPVALLQIVQQGDALFEMFRGVHLVWRIKPGRPANQRVGVCKKAPGAAGCAESFAG